jgi:hypothetical protein
MLTEISRDSFREMYLLGRQVAHEGVRSFEARDTADQQVMVHLLGAVDGPEAVPWLAAVGALPAERRAGLLAAFQVEGEAILVTEFQPEVRSLADWFVSTSSRRGGAPPTPAVQDGEKAPVSPTVPADEVAEGEDAARGMETAVESPAQAQVSDSDRDAGEFTKMFGHEQGPSPSAVPPEPIERPAASADAPIESEPSPVEFEQAPSQQADKEQGEFTARSER